MFKIFRRLVWENPLLIIDGNNRSDFTVDQGAMILHELGELYGLGDLQMGIWRPEQEVIKKPTDPCVTLCPFPGCENKAANHTIWLIHTGNTEGGACHYSVIVSGTASKSPAAVEKILSAQEVPEEKLEKRVNRIWAVNDAMKERHDERGEIMSIADVTDKSLQELVCFHPEQQIRRIIRQASLEELKSDSLGMRAYRQRMEITEWRQSHRNRRNPRPYPRHLQYRRDPNS